MGKLNCHKVRQGLGAMTKTAVVLRGCAAVVAVVVVGTNKQCEFSMSCVFGVFRVSCVFDAGDNLAGSCSSWCRFVDSNLFSNRAFPHLSLGIFTHISSASEASAQTMAPNRRNPNRILHSFLPAWVYQQRRLTFLELIASCATCCAC
jgi:hypothetical protein